MIFHNVWETRDPGAKSAELRLTAWCQSFAQHTANGPCFPCFLPFPFRTGVSAHLPSLKSARWPLFLPHASLPSLPLQSPDSILLWPELSAPGLSGHLSQGRMRGSWTGGWAKLADRGGQSRPAGLGRQRSGWDGQLQTRPGPGAARERGLQCRGRSHCGCTRDWSWVQVSAGRSSWARRTEFSFQKRQAHTC